jgi:hypothetical protein
MLPHPISDTYLDKRILRPDIILELLSAWDALPLIVPCGGFQKATLYSVYTPNALSAGGGIVEFKIEVSNDDTGNDWFQLAAYTQPNVASGADTASLVQQMLIDYGATSLNAELFTIQSINISGFQRLRIDAREIGDAVNPGNFAVEVTFG